MKKIVFSLLALAATMNIMAVDYTAYAKIKIASNSGYSINAMYVSEAAEESYAVLNEDEPFYIGIYSIYNNTNYQGLTLNELGELPIGFKAAPAEQSVDNLGYKLMVTDVKGSKTLYLKDLAIDSVIALTANREYEFTIENAQVGQKVENRFQLYVAPTKDYTRDAATVVGNWYTICVPGGVDATEYAPVMDVYTVGGYNAAQGLAVDPLVGAMQPGVPYIFQAKATQIAFNYNEEVAASDPQPGTNYLTGTFEETTTPEKAYVVANNMLNWVASATVPANRAYLNYADITDGNFPVVNPLLPAPGRKFLPAPKAMPTGLDGAAINGLQNGKFIMNGRFMIVKDGKTTNVLGL